MESKKLYDVEIIIKKCDNIENKKEFINYVAQIIKEKNPSFLYQIYAVLKRDFIIKTLEKTLKIMNEGGISKNEKSEITNGEDGGNIRSIGGTFIYLVKTSELISKDMLKKIFWRNKKKKEIKKKLYKSFNKLNINIANDEKEPKQAKEKDNK